MEFIRLDPNIQIPQQGSPWAAGYDLQAALSEPLVLAPSQVALIPSGIAIHINNPQWVGLLFARSGLGHKKGLVLGNGTGVIDADYQGEIKISLWNRSQETHTIEPYARIAQLLIVPVVHPTFQEVSRFNDATDRNSKGFGSSGD